MTSIIQRSVPLDASANLVKQGLHPVLARVYAARGVSSTSQIEYDLKDLPPFGQMKGAVQMAERLADALAANQRLLVIADYDSDGATACTVAVRALRAFGADVDFLVPNRFEYGYGLTPEIVRLAAHTKPDILITVDNGIASVAGVEEAHRLGMAVLVTDHHLPGETLPQAAAIVNPNQPGCEFPSKNLAGVGVIFYVMLALRAVLRERGAFADRQEPNLGHLLDLVALGTVADVVQLDDLNRTLVSHGLNRIRSGKACPGIAALMQVAGRNLQRASSWDLGFALGPRLNAAGRLDDMALGIACLLADEPGQAFELAQRLDGLNRERRGIEAGMHDQALASLEQIDVGDNYSLCLFEPEWHQGVIGILASRIKEKYHRPVIAFAGGQGGELKGSGRSIHGLHLRDALDLVSKRQPALLKKFGGHAMAAGLTLDRADFPLFQQTFEAVCRELLPPDLLTRTQETDGTLDSQEMTLALAQLIRNEVWGQAFPDPAFEGVFSVLQQRIVGEKHLKLRLEQATQTFDAMFFFHAEPLPERIRAIYRLDVNEYNGSTSLRLLIAHWEAN
ncbi:MAG: single-stranded-DNA-specific exonuclease RecJ [Sulfuricellaceae bacterium]|nr:single-stranded-DNA-specific exonuclease RecJ [Sulfuricellaceae bacterium]